MQRGQKYDQDLRSFLDEQGGRIAMLSDDALFVRTVRTTIFKMLAVKSDCVYICQDSSKALKVVRELVGRKSPLLVLVDRLLRGVPTLEFLRGVKGAFPEVKLLVITQETSKAELSQLYEIGVDSVITKPVSVDTLVEKMAGAVKPQSKISELVQEGRRFLALGESDNVRRVCQAILQLKPSSPVGFMLMGDAYLLDGRREDAVRAYEAAHKGATLYLEPLKKLAEAHKGHEDEEYLHYLRKLDRISPLNTERKCELGKAYAKRNDFVRADEYFTQAISTAQREALAYVDRIVSDIAESVAELSPALTEKYYVKVLEMKGDNLGEADMITFNRLGIALRRQGKWQEAIDYYKRALTVVPDDERVLYNMGLAYVDGRQFRMAIGVYEKVLRANPQFLGTAPVVAFNIASAYALVGNSVLARKYVEFALGMDPAHKASLRLLAQLDRDKKKNA